MQTRALLLLLTTTPLLAQTTTTRTTTTAAPARRTAATTTAVSCAKLPELSPKIPALPAGTSCPKPLFTVTRTQPIHADYISPLVSPDLRAVLDPPAEVISLVYADVKPGTGPLIQHGKNTEVLYTGYLVDGTVFDSSTDRTKPFAFPLGGHRVIPGWDMGLEGMRIGGKRRLFVPYTLAYGEQGRPPRIPPKSMLIFDIEVLAQNDAPPTPPAGLNRPAPRPGAPTGAAPAAAPGSATPPATAAPSSPAGAAAPPPVTSTTPATSTQPTPPTTSAQPKPQQ